MSDLVGNPEDRFSQKEAHMNFVIRKPVFRFSDQKNCKFQILEIGGLYYMYLHCSQNKGTVQLVNKNGKNKFFSQQSA